MREGCLGLLVLSVQIHGAKYVLVMVWFPGPLSGGLSLVSHP